MSKYEIKDEDVFEISSHYFPYLRCSDIRDLIETYLTNTGSVPGSFFSFNQKRDFLSLLNNIASSLFANFGKSYILDNTDEESNAPEESEWKSYFGNGAAATINNIRFFLDDVSDESGINIFEQSKLLLRDKNNEESVFNWKQNLLNIVKGYQTETAFKIIMNNNIESLNKLTEACYDKNLAYAFDMSGIDREEEIVDFLTEINDREALKKFIENPRLHTTDKKNFTIVKEKISDKDIDELIKIRKEIRKNREENPDLNISEMKSVIKKIGNMLFSSANKKRLQEAASHFYTISDEDESDIVKDFMNDLKEENENYSLKIFGFKPETVIASFGNLYGEIPDKINSEKLNINFKKVSDEIENILFNRIGENVREAKINEETKGIVDKLKEEFQFLSVEESGKITFRNDGDMIDAFLWMLGDNALSDGTCKLSDIVRTLFKNYKNETKDSINSESEWYNWRNDRIVNAVKKLVKRLSNIEGIRDFKDSCFNQNFGYVSEVLHIDQKVLITILNNGVSKDLEAFMDDTRLVRYDDNTIKTEILKWDPKIIDIMFASMKRALKQCKKCEDCTEDNYPYCDEYEDDGHGKCINKRPFYFSRYETNRAFDMLKSDKQLSDEEKSTILASFIKVLPANGFHMRRADIGAKLFNSLNRDLGLTEEQKNLLKEECVDAITKKFPYSKWNIIDSMQQEFDNFADYILADKTADERFEIMQDYLQTERKDEFLNEFYEKEETAINPLEAEIDSVKNEPETPGNKDNKNLDNEER